MNQEETKKLIEWVNKTFAFNEKDSQMFDLSAEMDRSLSYEENKRIIREKITSFFQYIKPTREEIKTREEQEKAERIKEREEEEEKSRIEFYKKIESIKENNLIESKLYEIPTEYIKAVCKGNIKGMLFCGCAGVGKTYLTRQILLKEGISFIESRGVSSALALYHFLYKNNDEKKVLLFDDVHGLINNPNAFSILLGALWDGLISWNTTSDKLEAPAQFLFKSKIIIIANEIQNIAGAEILKSRCLCYSLNFSWKEKIEVMYLIANQSHQNLSKEERIKIVDFIKENTDNSNIELDLRTQQKIENLYLYNRENWQELAKPLLKKDKILNILVNALKNSGTIREAEQEFIKESGLSRASFYRYRDKLSLNLV